LDTGLEASYAFQYACRIQKLFGSTLVLLSLSEKPSKFLRKPHDTDNLIQHQENVCKKVLSYYGHRARMLEIPFSMYAMVTSHMQKTILSAMRRFNIGTVVMSRNNLMEESALSRAVYNVMENADRTVIIVRPETSKGKFEQEELLAAIENERGLDLVNATTGDTTKVVFVEDDFTEFLFISLETVFHDIKHEQHDLEVQINQEEKNQEAALMARQREKKIKVENQKRAAHHKPKAIKAEDKKKSLNIKAISQPTVVSREHPIQELYEGKIRDTSPKGHGLSPEAEPMRGREGEPDIGRQNYDLDERRDESPLNINQQPSLDLPGTPRGGQEYDYRRQEYDTRGQGFDTRDKGFDTRGTSSVEHADDTLHGLRPTETRDTVGV
jgi:hypothetical protein